MKRGPNYRTLMVGEIIEPGDEGYNSSKKRWLPYPGEMIGRQVTIPNSSRRLISDDSPVPTPDMVNHPPHYQSEKGVECIDAIEAAMTVEEFRGYLRGNCLKYLWRSERKGGEEDLKKAAWYLNKLIETPKP